jgi:transposase
MTHYPPEFKASTIAKMLPPQSRSVRELAQETGIPKDTLYSWRTLAVKADPAAAPAPSGTGERSSAQKFAVVLQTSALDAAALSAYCRAQGR